MRRVFFFSCLVLVSCSPTPHPEGLQVPYADLSGPVPPRSGVDSNDTTYRSLLQEVLNKRNIKEVPGDLDAKNACMSLLEDCLSSKDLSIVLSTLSAYSLIQLSPPESCVDKFLSGDVHPYLQAQLLATLYETHSPFCKKASEMALRSNYPAIQLFGAEYLAETKAPNALAFIESMESKLPPELLPVVADLYAREGSPKAQANLRRLLHSGNSALISQCLCLIKRYELMELFNELASFQPTTPQEEEALAFALSINPTSASKETLLKLAQKPSAPVVTEALLSLEELGEEYSIDPYRSMVESHSPYLLFNLADTSLKTEDIEALWHEKLDDCERLSLAHSLMERNSNLSLPYLLNTLCTSESTFFGYHYSLAQTCFYVSKETKSDVFSFETLSKEYETQAFLEELVHKIGSRFPKAFQAFIDDENCMQKCEALAPAILLTLLDTTGDKKSEILQKLSLCHGQPFMRKLALFLRIQQGEVALEVSTLQSILTELRESLRSLMRPVSFFSFLQSTPGPIEYKKLTQQQKLYMLALGTLAQAKNQVSYDLLARELKEAPDVFTPFIAAALVHALL